MSQREESSGSFKEGRNTEERKKEQARIARDKDPFKFIKPLFSKEKGGSLTATEQGLGDHLDKVHTGEERYISGLNGDIWTHQLRQYTT